MPSIISDGALHSHRPSITAARPAHACLGLILRLVTAMALSAQASIARRRQLCELADLDDHLLRDVGLTRDDVARACGNRFAANDGGIASG